MTPASRFRFPLNPAIRALALCLAVVAAVPAAPADVVEELEASDPPAAPAAPSADSSRGAAAPPAVPADSATDSASASAPVPAPATAPAPAEGTVRLPDSAAGRVAADTAKAAAGSVPDAGDREAAGDLTIEVDESRSRNEGKSLPLAMFYSAVLPGAGELYLQEKGRAKTFLLVEAGFWAALYVSIVAKDSYLQSARNHASQYAGIDASSKDEDFLETMATYRSYLEKQHRQDSYELAQVLQYKRERDFDIPPAPENYWDFGSSANPENTRNWRQFQSTLRYYRASKVAMSFALGALAMNRLASMVNTLQTYKRTSARSARWDVTPDLGPDYAGTRLSIRF